MEKNKVCVWTLDKITPTWITGCNKTKIKCDNYIDKYCTCCGKRIVVLSFMTKQSTLNEV